MNHATVADQVHILLALVIAFSYLAIPLTAIRLIPLPGTAKWSGAAFFVTCAITHLATAFGFHDSGFMILNDAVQAVASVTFITTLSRLVTAVMKSRQKRPGEETAP